MAVNNYTNRRNVNAQANTRANAGAGNSRTAAQRGYAQYQYGTAAPQTRPVRGQRTSQAASSAYRQSAAQTGTVRRQNTAQASPARRQSESQTIRQSAPARRQAPQRHQVDVGTEKGKVILQASPVNKLGLVVIMLAFLALGAAVLWYVSLQSDITQLRSNIQSRESELNDLVASNDEYLNRIEASVDLEEVREVA
ncbi:MAG: hypothetical protein LUE87_00830, partial [Lachnospiraceae bacterium]|nr:hypothetical protein [Lachnospiraceae bacterium]